MAAAFSSCVCGDKVQIGKMIYSSPSLKDESLERSGGLSQHEAHDCFSGVGSAGCEWFEGI